LNQRANLNPDGRNRRATLSLAWQEP
jgi:hypothetical protein